LRRNFIFADLFTSLVRY